jgi:hypothetical protein
MTDEYSNTHVRERMRTVILSGGVIDDAPTHVNISLRGMDAQDA